MGKFVDTKFVNTVDNLTASINEKINNPYYKFTDKKPSKVTYYSQNIEKSTLDEASGLYEAHINSKSPIKFNKIKDFIIYGLEKITTEYDVGDFGIESNQIAGSAIILPNTITPRPGDFFSISYLKEDILFKINGVSSDTLDTGANIFKIDYAAEYTESIDNIDKQVDKNFNCITNNIGTDMKSIILNSEYKLIEKLESIVEGLIDIFYNVFFDSKLQTFIYHHDGYLIYDPYMIEFLKRNGILKYGDKYIYVDHATTINKTFAMDYAKTFFYNLENPDEDINCKNLCSADMITDPNSLFITRMHEYYCITFADNRTKFEMFRKDVIERIKENKYFDKGNEAECYNLWIAYFNNDTDFIKGDIISLIRNIDYMDSLEYFYMLTVSIFIIERGIEKLLN